MTDSVPEKLGKYKIIEEVGRGGFAAVYKAVDTTLNRPVALKVLAPHLLWDPTFVQRFQREAEVAANLDHPNIVTIYEVSQIEGVYFISMQFLEGQTLSQILEAEGPLPVSRVQAIIDQIAFALDYAHARGFVHRDIKPSNVIVADDGRATLTDFGLVKAGEGTKLSTTGVVFGTPEYMSPEQAEAKKLDARSDVYSLGVVLFEMLAGRAPFVADTTPAVMYKHVHEPPPLEELPSELLQGVVAVVEKALAKKREERHQSVGEMARALEEATEAGVEVTPIPPVVKKPVPEKVASPLVEPVAVAKKKPEPPTPKAVPKKALSLGVGALLAGGLVLLCIVGIIILAISGGPSTPTLEPPTPAPMARVTTPAPTMAPTATPIPPTFTPTRPSLTGRIVFESHRDGNWEIYMMNADGTGQIRLTKNEADDKRPAWSPDGRRIAFHSNRDGNWEIYVMNADGTNLRRLTSNPASDYSPAWSPDGRYIAFDSYRDGDGEIYVMNADGTNPHRLTTPRDDWAPAWSPDGRYIAFVSEPNGNKEIYVMNADGTNPYRLTNDSEKDTWPAWSPDGRYIAFGSNRDGNWEIYVMNADGTNLSRLTDNAADNARPAWSPDGRYIAFGSNRDGNWEIYMMNADGTNLRRLTDNSANDEGPAWSPW